MFEEAEARAEPAACSKTDVDRRRRIGAVGADGNHRHGAADRVRERREPAARPRRRPAAGAGASARRSAPAAAGSPTSCSPKASSSASSAASRARRRLVARSALLIALAPGNLPRLDNITIDATVLLFTLGDLDRRRPALRCDPGLQVRRPARGRRACAAAGARRARAASVIARAARWWSCRWRWRSVLLVGSGLMIRTFQALRHVDPGLHESAGGADAAA